MKRSGFTMIELIFVIVILGILAAVAIPKLAATRDDAKISKIATNIATAKNELASFVTATGNVSVAVDKELYYTTASNVITEMINSQDGLYGDATGVFNGPAISIVNKDVGNEVCMTVEMNGSDIVTQKDITAVSPICLGVQALVPDSNVSVAGSRVIY